MDDMFGSDSDSEGEQMQSSSKVLSGAQQFFTSSFIALMKMKAQVRCKVSVGGMEEVVLDRSIAVLLQLGSSETDEQAKSLADEFVMKLSTTAKFKNVKLLSASVANNESGESLCFKEELLQWKQGPDRSFDALVHCNASQQALSDEDVVAMRNKLVPGGTLLTNVNGAASDSDATLPPLPPLSDLSALFKAPHWVAGDCAGGNINNGEACLVYRRRGVDVNVRGAEYWGATGDGAVLENERSLVEDLTVYTTTGERDGRIFAAATVEKAECALRTHGFCIFPGLFKRKEVKKWGDAALGDLEEALHKLKGAYGIDLLRPGEGPRIENFHELGMREALRCDIRNGRRMKALKVQEEGEAKAAAGKEAAKTVAKNPAATSHVPTGHLRSHPAIASLLATLSNPVGDPSAAKGNWGRWNFEGGGPEAPPVALDVNDVGAVMSLPGCSDQTIHADTAHLYTHVQLPAHYYNLFLPAVGGSESVERGVEGEISEEEPLSCSHLVGQTAFVSGSHVLATSAAVMTQVGGQDLLNSRLVRPHLREGDALLFDCRILHFGLSNQTAPFESPSEAQGEAQGEGKGGILGSNTSQSVCRPLLYINYTQSFFTDPKNWNDKDRLFD